MQQHLETWLAHRRERDFDGVPLPRHVERELRGYLECGILACGFARARCGDCGHDLLVAFSCKGRGICPSCTTRRMAGTAAHLVGHVFPQVPVRQWVVTFPGRLRYFLRRDPVLLARVRRSVLPTIESGLRRCCADAPRDAHFGAVRFVQRFGSALNATPTCTAASPTGCSASLQTARCISTPPSISMRPRSAPCSSGSAAACCGPRRPRPARPRHRPGRQRRVRLRSVPLVGPDHAAARPGVQFRADPGLSDPPATPPRRCNAGPPPLRHDTGGGKVRAPSSAPPSAQATARRLQTPAVVNSIARLTAHRLQLASGAPPGHASPHPPLDRNGRLDVLSLMRKILEEGVAIGNATARSLTFRPREERLYFYPGQRQSYSPFTGGSSEFMNNGERVLDDRIVFHDYATGITPAMARAQVGTGSAYAIGAHDSEGRYLDGGKTYTVTLPAPVPAKDFWSFVVYDNQTRSVLEADQKSGGVDSNSKDIKANADGSYTIWFAPEPPAGKEGNWVKTMPGKSYNVLLRLYGPLQPFFDKTWIPGDFELVDLAAVPKQRQQTLSSAVSGRRRSTRQEKAMKPFGERDMFVRISVRCNSGVPAVALIGVLLSNVAQADAAADLAKQLANPLAALISVPMQLNYDENFGADDGGSVLRINVQPVIPVSISDDWNLISRTILPIVDQRDVPVPGVSEFGLGDTVQSLFFSPKAPTAGGWIWGAGPVLLLPTATDQVLGSEKWGLGPTAVALKQSGPWTYGGLINHIESFAGDSGRADISATFLNPFLSYITPTKTTFGLNTEATYDWNGKAWSVPINLTVSQLLKIGKQPVQLGGGIRYWADSPDAGPKDWGFRLQLTLLFPK